MFRVIIRLIGDTNIAVETFYSDLSSGVSTVDATVYANNPGTFAQIIARGGDVAVANNADTGNFIYLVYATTQYGRLDRYLATIDVSGFTGVANNITGVTFQFYPLEINDDGTSQAISLVSSAPANDNAIVATDFDSGGTTKLATDLTIDNITINQLNSFTLNATGIQAVKDAIAGTGIFKLGIKLASELSATDPSLTGTQYILVSARTVDIGTAGQKPRLVITYSTDTTPPVITLLGEATVSVKQYETYTDAGATALDAVDGDLTSSIVTVNPVDTDIVGTYTITYNVSDSMSNDATEVTRTVTVTPLVTNSAKNNVSATNSAKNNSTVTNINK